MRKQIYEQQYLGDTRIIQERKMKIRIKKWKSKRRESYINQAIQSVHISINNDEVKFHTR